MSKYKRRAIYKGHEFALTFAEFNSVVVLPCFYCGTNTAPRGIDRWDSKIGYVLENCRPCCSRCNYAKHAMDGAEFFDHIQRMAEHMRLEEWADLMAAVEGQPL